MMNFDRRRNIRFGGQKKVVVIQPGGIHHLRDISLGGLSFRCPRDVVFAGEWPLEIMVADSLLRVIRVPVRMVREQPDAVDPFVPPSKEVGVEYLTLDPHNRPLLARLLFYLQQTEFTPCR